MNWRTIGVGVALACWVLFAGFALSTGTPAVTPDDTADQPTVVCDAFVVNNSTTLMCFAQGDVTVTFGFNETNVHGTLWTD